MGLDLVAESCACRVPAATTAIRTTVDNFIDDFAAVSQPILFVLAQISGDLRIVFDDVGQFVWIVFEIVKNIAFEVADEFILRILDHIDATLFGMGKRGLVSSLPARLEMFFQIAAGEQIDECEARHAAPQHRGDATVVARLCYYGRLMLTRYASSGGIANGSS